MSYQAKPYKPIKDAMYEDDCEVSEAVKEHPEAWDKGWEEGLGLESPTSFEEMTDEDYENRLGEEAVIVNLKGLLNIHPDKPKMVDYIKQQMSVGACPTSIAVGYTVNLIDWLKNPDPEDFVVVSSREIMTPHGRHYHLADEVIAARGHWCLYLRKENLDIFQDAPLVSPESEKESAGDGEITPTEVAGRGEATQRTVIRSRTNIGNVKANLYVNWKTGEEEYFPEGEKVDEEWIKTQTVLVGGKPMTTTLRELRDYLRGRDDVEDIELSGPSMTFKTDKGSDIKSLIDEMNFFTTTLDGKQLTVEY